MSKKKLLLLVMALAPLVGAPKAADAVMSLAVSFSNPSFDGTRVFRDCSTEENINGYGDAYTAGTIFCSKSTTGTTDIASPCTGATVHRARIRHGQTMYPGGAYNPPSGIQTTWTGVQSETLQIFAYDVALGKSDCFNTRLPFEVQTQGLN